MRSRPFAFGLNCFMLVPLQFVTNCYTMEKHSSFVSIIFSSTEAPFLLTGIRCFTTKEESW
jgi:hypothetical protein